jgi:hypothetical protein
MHFFIVVQSEETFTFTALWGEQMVARPSDAIDRGGSDSSPPADGLVELGEALEMPVDRPSIMPSSSSANGWRSPAR